MDDTDYALGRTLGEYERLTEQAELLRPLTERMLVAAGICHGMHVLDVGCGVGDVSFLVASIVGSQGSVIGVDLDREAIRVAEARRRAKKITNVEFRQSDARSEDFGRGFDAAVGRLVLMFISEPTAALRQIADRVRDGGIIAFQERGTRVTAVSSAGQPLFTYVQNLINRTLERSGARLEIGTELFRRMVDAGLEPGQAPIAEIALQMGQDGVASHYWASLVRSILPKMIAYGVASEEEVGIDTLEQRLSDESKRVGSIIPASPLLIAQWARKPGTAG
jgi:ubiquinone/menaquinone biosynthesis C-methylase UbiE